MMRLFILRGEPTRRAALLFRASGAIGLFLCIAFWVAILMLKVGAITEVPPTSVPLIECVMLAIPVQVCLLAWIQSAHPTLLRMSNRKYVLHFLLSLCVLSIPALTVPWMLWIGPTRLAAFGNVLILGNVAFLLSVFLPNKWDLLSTVTDATGFYRTVSWDLWNSREMERTHLTPPKAPEPTFPVYTDAELIQAFQESLTCPVLDSEALVSVIAARRFNHPIRILDIGGGDGTLTLNVLRGLRKARTRVLSVTNLDPAPIISIYQRTLEKGFPDLNVVCLQKRIEEFGSDQYDVVLASHSLYASFEMIGQGEPTLHALVNKLSSLRAENGLFLVVLSSEKSNIHVFKREALGDLFERHDPSVTAEALLKRFPKEFAEILVLDNAVNFTATDGFVDEAGHFHCGDKTMKWLAYFLREDSIRSLYGEGRQTFENLLSRHVILAESLPEVFFERLHNKCAIEPGTVVALHKALLLELK